MVGSALLVAGYDLDGATLASAGGTLGEIGEALLATGTAWRVRRVDAAHAPLDRASLKRAIADLFVEDCEVALLVVVGAIVEGSRGPALVAGEAVAQYPDDATLELSWIGDRLRETRAQRVCAIVSARAIDPDYATWLAPLGSTRQDLIAVHAPPTRHRLPLADALLDGLYGDAIDPATGTITVKSLGAHIARTVPDAELRASTASLTLASSPPLDRMSQIWDMRRSLLAARHRKRPEIAPELVGTVLPGRFRVDTQIARGTFGTVYRAHQLAIERDVAIKVLHADIEPTSDDGRLFVHEITSVGRIDHPGVVRIFQADITHDGRLFFAMELLDGQDLQSIGVIGAARAVALVRAMLDGLRAAHDAGLVHADIKPANAILVGDTRVVLVDFGLARLRPDRGAADSVGGTPAFMAPEQLSDGRVDQRSDLFSAALVLVFLATGWRRTTAKALAPPDDELAKLPPQVRAALGRAFAIDPAQRFTTALEFAEALEGRIVTPTPPARPRPFQHLAPLVDRVFGRERDLAILVDHVLFGRSVIYTAPSGTGKTSLLRAGLLPRLEALGKSVAYRVARDGVSADAEVLVIDQAEAALDTIPVGSTATRVIAVREDQLARVIERFPSLPVVRLAPLDREGARAAILGPLAEARIAVEPALVDTLLDDLERAAGSGTVFPPHLQLACTVLCEDIDDGETITLARYRALGGFDAIAGEYLERVLDGELSESRAAIARDLLVAMVDGTERAVRDEAELLELVEATNAEIRAVLSLLRDRGILIATRTHWELAHDSLIPRVAAWLDRRDLARRRAIELVRFHVRRARAGTPSLLTRRELREVRPYDAAIAQLDPDHRDLVLRSRTAVRNRAIALTTALIVVLAVATIAIYRNRVEHARVVRERSLHDRDIGRFRFAFDGFDWDPATRTTTPVALPGLSWTLHYPDAKDPEVAGRPFSPEHLEVLDDGTIEAHGGRAFLVVHRGPCAPSTIPLHALPGYADRDRDRTLHVSVPSCAASRADTIEVPEGPFIVGGPGVPASKYALDFPQEVPEATIDMRRFAVDRLEVSNAAYALYTGEVTGIQMPPYPAAVRGYQPTPRPDSPVAGVLFAEARGFCAYFGKVLPTAAQWQKTLRGGLKIDGQPNPTPRRNYPWGTLEARDVAIHSEANSTVRPVGSTPDDRSPYGVLDLAGNVSEWTQSYTDGGAQSRVVRGANWVDTTPTEFADYMAIDNLRLEIFRNFGVGFRCISE